MVFIKKLIVLIHQRHLEKDKQQHFAVSFFLFIFICFFVNIGYALLLTFIVGLLKEVWDEFYGSGFCLWDMVANFLGILVGFCLVSFYYFLLVI